MPRRHSGMTDSRGLKSREVTFLQWLLVLCWQWLKTKCAELYPWAKITRYRGHCCHWSHLRYSFYVASGKKKIWGIWLNVDMHMLTIKVHSYCIMSYLCGRSSLWETTKKAENSRIPWDSFVCQQETQRPGAPGSLKWKQLQKARWFHRCRPASFAAFFIQRVSTHVGAGKTQMNVMNQLQVLLRV